MYNYRQDARGCIIISWWVELADCNQCAQLAVLRCYSINMHYLTMTNTSGLSLAAYGPTSRKSLCEVYSTFVSLHTSTGKFSFFATCRNCQHCRCSFSSGQFTLYVMWEAILVVLSFSVCVTFVAWYKMTHLLMPTTSNTNYLMTTIKSRQNVRVSL